MSNSILVKAKPGCATEINQHWQQAFKGECFLIFEKTYIELEVESIQSGTNNDFKHLKPFVKTVEDWNDRFPTFAVDCGMVFLSVHESIFTHSQHFIDDLKNKIGFLDQYHYLFASIEGIRELAEQLNINLSTELLASKETICHTKPCFKEMDTNPKSDIYQLCKLYNCPGLWKAYSLFLQNPIRVNWDKLKLEVVPWSGGIIEDNVWGLCEKAATQRDHKDYGLAGRFINGVIPSEFELRQALLITPNNSTRKARLPAPGDKEPLLCN